MNTTNTPNMKVNNHIEVMDALLDTVERLNRASIIAVLGGEAGLRVSKEHELDGIEKLEFLVERRALAESSFSIYKDVMSDYHPVYTDKTIEYSFKNIPVKIKILDRKYKFLENPAVTSYLYDPIFLPNPFNSYYKARGLVS